MPNKLIIFIVQSLQLSGLSIDYDHRVNRSEEMSLFNCGSPILKRASGRTERLASRTPLSKFKSTFVNVLITSCSSFRPGLLLFYYLHIQFISYEPSNR